MPGLRCPYLHTDPILSQILEAVSRKITMSPDIDLGMVAAETEGYSGADLQALLYNAHLDVIHETLAHVTEGSKFTGSKGDEDVGLVQYTEIGGSTASPERVLSKAEKDAFQRRVSVASHILRTVVEPRASASTHRCQHAEGLFTFSSHSASGCSNRKGKHLQHL